MSPHAENITMHLSRPVQTEVDIFDLNPKCSLEVLNQSLYIRRMPHSKALLKVEAKSEMVESLEVLGIGTRTQFLIGTSM